MFKKIMNFLRKGAAYLGLIKSIEKITDHKDISANKEIYDKIDVWKDLYKGYHKPWHDLRYKTIDGMKTRRMDTLNMGKVVSEEMASLVFNEKCDISISDNKTSDYIKDDVFKRNKFYKKFQDYLEYMFGLSGMVVKPYVKDDKLLLSYVTADCFIPISWQNETIIEAVFPNEFQKGDKKYTHLEWHLRTNTEKGMGYTIKNEVYESRNGEDLGIKVPLEQFFPGLEEEVGIHPLEKPIFVYFKPNIANNVDTQSPLGISIFANALDTMRAIDVAFDSFHREFRLGKKRILVPAPMVKTIIDPETGQPTRYFDSTDETFEAMAGEFEENKILDLSVELRVEEHVAGINALLNIFAMQTGFSAGTFTFDGQSMKTATEVISEQSKTFKSKQSHEIIIEAGLQELIESIVAIAGLYGLFNAPDKLDITVTFDDSIAEDADAEANRQIKLVQAELQSKKRAIMKIFGVTEDDAVEILTEIIEEIKQAAPTIDNSMFGGTE